MRPEAATVASKQNAQVKNLNPLKRQADNFGASFAHVSSGPLTPGMMHTCATHYLNNLESKYNSIRILGMARPVPLRSVYVRVNIVNTISAHRRTTIEDLEKLFDSDRRGYQETQMRSGLRAIEDYDKLIV